MAATESDTMYKWSLEILLEELHKSISDQLARARRSLSHSVAKGDATEGVWIELLSEYLPKRYCVTKAFVCDSLGQFSEQLDVVIYDRQYSPLIFKLGEQTIIPAESIYAAFEAKQAIDAAQVEYAGKKIESVRKLHRTSLPVPHIDGESPAKQPAAILGGLITFESDWSPPLGKPLNEVLESLGGGQRLDLGCVAAHGWFRCDDRGCNIVTNGGKPVTAFLLELIAQLQRKATVPMIDVRAYAKWLA